MAELKKKNISGAILAGGNASRLNGIAKGKIEAGDGSCIIERLIKQFHAAGINDIVIIANDSKLYQNYGVKVIPDLMTGNGPIGGIQAALVHYKKNTDAVMFVPCDMPKLTAKELLSLKEAFIKTNKPVVFAETPGFFWHPLCAVVHIGLIDIITSSIYNGQLKIRDLWQKIDAEPVPFSDCEAFLNINDFADMEKLANSGSRRSILCSRATAKDK